MGRSQRLDVGDLGPLHGRRTHSSNNASGAQSGVLQAAAIAQEDEEKNHHVTLASPILHHDNIFLQVGSNSSNKSLRKKGGIRRISRRIKAERRTNGGHR